MRTNQKGFGAAETLVVFIIVGLICVVGWLLYDMQKDAKNTEKPASKGQQVKKSQASKGTEEASNKAVKTSIYPNDSTGKTSSDFFTVTLPSGWAVEKVFEPYNIVKTIGSDKYLISSSIEENSDRNLMDQRVSEGMEAITSVTTDSGTNVHVLRTPTVLFLASCKPTGENCYLQLRNQKLYVHLYKVVPGAQSATPTDFPEEILQDFESIAKSLSI